MEILRESREGFAQSEDCATPAQSGPKTAEEINLVCKIEARTKSLIQSLNSIESLTNKLEKNLLPQRPKDESKVGVDQKPPQGWLECHLADLGILFSRTGQIYNEVTRLTQETKTDKIGQ